MHPPRFQRSQDKRQGVAGESEPREKVEDCLADEALDDWELTDQMSGERGAVSTAKPALFRAGAGAPTPLGRLHDEVSGYAT